MKDDTKLKLDTLAFLIDTGNATATRIKALLKEVVAAALLM